MSYLKLLEQTENLTKKEAEKFARASVAHYQSAYNLINKELKKTYNGVLSGVKPDDYYEEMLKNGRLDKLIKKTQASYRQAAKASGQEVFRSSNVSMSNLYYRQLYAANWLTESSYFKTLNPSLIELTVKGTPKAWADITSRAKKEITKKYGNIKNYQPKYGNVTKMLLDNNIKGLREIESAVIQSFTNGKGIRDAAKEIRGIFNKSANHSITVIRTESHRVASSAQYALANASRAAGIEFKRKILSTLDDRTRDQSAYVDGEVENDQGYFSYPDGAQVAIPGNSGVAGWDINDRETTINIVDGQDPELRRARNPVTGKTDIISYKEFPEWAKENNLTKNAYGQMYTKKT